MHFCSAIRGAFSAAFLSIVVAGCTGSDGITGPEDFDQEPPDRARALMALKCAAQVSTKTVWCSVDPAFSGLSVPLPGFGLSRDWSPIGPVEIPSEAILIGQQHVNLSVLTGNVLTPVDSFYFDTRLANRSPAPIGTIDGENSDGSIRIFFQSGPTTTAGSGVVTVANPTGFDSFTSANQPYFGYPDILFQEDTTAAQTWRLQRDPGVTSFVFSLLVSASVEHPAGFVKVVPSADTILISETTQLTDSVKNALGWPVEGETVEWLSSDELVATVSPAGVVSGIAEGTVTITATSGARTGSAEIRVVDASNAAPVSVADSAASASVVNDPYHIPQTALVTYPAPGVLSNDDLGTPAATIVSFGGDSLGGSVTDHAAGATATADGISITLDADGRLVMQTDATYNGYFVFRYRLQNSAGFSDGLVKLAIGHRPSATNSTYAPNLLGNIDINTTGTGTGVTFTGSNPEFTIVSETNGDATIHADGAFSFEPDLGHTGAASFTFNVTNGFGTSADATVTLDVAAPRIWFVDSAAAPGGNGKRSTPFNCLVGIGCIGQHVAAEGDIIYLAAGKYTNGTVFILEDNLRIIGQGASGNFADVSNANVTWPAAAGAQPVTGSTRPSVKSSDINVFQVGTGNTIRGLDVGATSGGPSITGAEVGNLVIGSAAIINPTGNGILLTTSGTLAVALDSIITSGGSGIGIDLSNQSGTFTSGVTRVTNPAGTGINVLNSSGFSFGTTVIKKTTDGIGVNLKDNTGTTSFASLVDSTTRGDALVALNAGTVTIGDGNIRTFQGIAVNVLGTTFNATLDSVTAVSPGGPGILFGGGSVVNAALGTGAIFTSLGGFSVTGATGTITYSGSISDVNRPVSVNYVSPGACPSMNLSGTISSAALGIHVQNCTSGDIRFSGPVTLNTGSNPAVRLVDNGDATIRFTGGSLGITTTTGNGFDASGGGALSVTGANNTITTAGGTALSVVNSRIASDGLTFRNITATGGSNGIRLDATGILGGLTVTGAAEGTDNCGGSPNLAGTEIPGVAAECTGGTIQGISGPDGSGTEGVAIALNNTGRVSLQRMRITGVVDNVGISADSVAGLAVKNSLFDGTTGIAVGDGVVRATHLRGASEFSGNAFLQSTLPGLLLIDDPIDAGDLRVEDNIFNKGRGEGVSIETISTSIAPGITVSGNRFTEVELNLDMALTTALTISNNVFRGGTAVSRLQLIIFGITTSFLDYSITGNSFYHGGSATGAPAIRITQEFDVLQVQGTISNNTIGDPGTAGSGMRAGILLLMDNVLGRHAVRIANNTIVSYGSIGIDLTAMTNAPVGGAPRFNATIEGNAIGSGPTGIGVEVGEAPTGQTNVCVDVKNNVSNAAAQFENLLFTRLGAAKVHLPGYLGGLDDNAAVSTYFNARNTLGSITIASGPQVVGFDDGFVNGGASCVLPPP